MITLKRIGWENGNLIEQAKVLSDGTIQPAQYEGSTPLSASNLKKMEDNAEEILNEIDERLTSIEEKNYIVTYLSGNQSIYNATNSTFNMATADIKGDCFELDSTNHQIKVLKDCVAILSGALFVDGSNGDNYIWAKITVNGNNITSNLARIINRDYTTCSIPTKVVSLKENDIIKMLIDYTSESGNPSIRASHDCSFVSVVKV